MNEDQISDHRRTPGVQLENADREACGLSHVMEDAPLRIVVMIDPFWTSDQGSREMGCTAADGPGAGASMLAWVGFAEIRTETAKPRHLGEWVHRCYRTDVDDGRRGLSAAGGYITVSC
ncbi:hypothetical protein [Ferranicluibacter rubi]|uniref:Uncharacterized protein n=1 Tax=Ferranicluibacter rubi TaxID=2715133 RepID=A0AA43ZHP8_9HYPH|nr:hypothetical protein [Ferranicluibacter rubi]NHT77235.1 hypothetical protein [Ferranicluibacter rubi]